MIQKGIIAQVIDKYNYKVRIPKYDKIESATYSTKLEDLSSGIVCTIPGIDIAYSLGDVVLVSFENDEISKPIILGLLYRDFQSDSNISVSNVDSSLLSIKDNLNKLNSSTIYTHIKYSNDNGLTFTSLFSTYNYESIIDGNVVCQPYFDPDTEIKGIQIDKKSRVINWSIIDDNNNDITSTIGIETTIFDSSGNIISKTNKDDKKYNITINNSSQINGDLYITYKLFITKEYLDTLHILLTTDKEPFGVTQGKYLGIYISNNAVPSINPADYHWFSFTDAFKDYLSELTTKIDIDINAKILDLKEELEENFVTIYYKEVEWTQAEVDVYCVPGYYGMWSRDMVNGYTGEVKAGNIIYITVHNLGTDINDTSDDSYGRLEIRADQDSAAGEPVFGTVTFYDVSGEFTIDALVRFKSSLLEPGDETLVYGGHITTGSITAQQITVDNIYSQYNNSYINLHNGTFYYTDRNSNKGLYWDGEKLIINGRVEISNSTSLTDSNGLISNAAIEVGGRNVLLNTSKSYTYDGYTLIEEEPLDWDTHWIDYYYYSNETFTYLNLPATLLATEPSDWETNWTDYYTYTSGVGYQHVTGASAPTFQTNTYYKGVEFVPDTYYRSIDIDSGEFIILNVYDMSGSYISLDLNVDEYITLSYDWTSSGVPSGTINLSGGTSTSTDSYVDIFGNLNVFQAGSHSGRVEKTVKLTNDIVNCEGNALKFKLYSSVAISFGEMSLTFSNVKLEKGNKATDWTVAPEDVDNAISDSTEAAYQNANTQISNLSSELNSYQEATSNNFNDLTGFVQANSLIYNDKAALIIDESTGENGVIIQSSADPYSSMKLNNDGLYLLSLDNLVASIFVSKNYAVLTTEPADWSTDWTDYYSYNVQTGIYTHLGGSQAPTFVANTYYEEVPGKGVFRASDSILSNIYMRSDEESGAAGNFAWVAQSNGHLSLKKVTL